MNQLHGDFEEKVDEFGWTRWVHRTYPIWVRFYPETDARRAHYHAFRAVQPVPAGRSPSSVDNRRITPERGVESLEAAIATCEAFIASVAA